MLIHTVYFWLKPGTPAAAKEQLVNECRSLLTPIPSVKQLWAGVPAATPPRSVLDSTYDVGLCVVFDDLAGHDVYESHPLHLEFIVRNQQHWDRAQVRDFVH